MPLMLTHLTIDLSTELRICSEQKGIDELKYSPSNRTAVNEEFPETTLHERPGPN